MEKVTLGSQGAIVSRMGLGNMGMSRRSADLFFRSAARPRWTRKSHGPKKQVRATLPRPEFLPIMGRRTAVNAQNDSAYGLFRNL